MLFFPDKNNEIKNVVAFLHRKSMTAILLFSGKNHITVLKTTGFSECCIKISTFAPWKKRYF